MIEKSTFKFLEKLQQNNNREWFAENKADYKSAHQNVLDFVSQVYQNWAADEPAYLDAMPQKSMFRIYRDMRFSKDDKPYKDHFGVVLSPQGTKARHAAIYLQVSPSDPFVAAGIWRPERDALARIRQEIDYTDDRFECIMSTLGTQGWTLDQGDKLMRPPKGYDINHDFVEYLKLKSYTVSRPLTQKELTTKNFANKLDQYKSELSKFLQFINDALI